MPPWYPGDPTMTLVRRALSRLGVPFLFLDQQRVLAMTVELSVCAWVTCWDLAQKFWSCCQNEPLPMLVIDLAAPYETADH